MFRKAPTHQNFAREVQRPNNAVQVDWEQRDFTQSIQLGVTQLTAFLNDFGARADGENNTRRQCVFTRLFLLF